MSFENKGSKKNFWKEHSEAWKSSGLTQIAYCAQKEISYRSFVYQHHRVERKLRRPSMNFVEAKAEASTANSQTAGLQLMLPNGIRIGISSEVNAVLLKTVLTIAGGVSC